MLQFTQQEIEKEIDDIVAHSDRRDIARITQIYESVIYGMFNPNDERKSYFVGYLQLQCALDEINSERGERLWQLMKRFRELSKKREHTDLCVGLETGSLNKEVADVVTAHLQGKSYLEQLVETDQAEAQLARTKKAILCAIDREKKEIAAAYITNGSKVNR